MVFDHILEISMNRYNNIWHFLKKYLALLGKISGTSWKNICAQICFYKMVKSSVFYRILKISARRYFYKYSLIFVLVGRSTHSMMI